MTPPVLSVALPRGSSAIRAIFDQPMHEIGDLTDPATVGVWSLSGPGSPAVLRVDRLSNLEFELHTSPLTVGTSYTLTLAATVQSAAGMPLSAPASTTVVPSVYDMSVEWFSLSPTQVRFEFTLVGSNAGLTLAAEETPFSIVPEVTFLPLPQFTWEAAGQYLTVTIPDGLTLGAGYRVEFNRDLITTTGGNVLLPAYAVQTVIGSGVTNPVALLPVSATADKVVFGSTEVLGTLVGTAEEGFAPHAGLYSSSLGDLGSEVQSPISVRAEFPKAHLTAGSGTAGVRKTKIVKAGGSSFLASFSGPVTEVVSAGSTVLTKGAGSTAEVVFSGNGGSLTKAAREVSLTAVLSSSLGSGGGNRLLFGITLLNTQITVMFSDEAGATRVSIYKGPLLVRKFKREVNVFGNVTIRIVDALAEGGFLSVDVNTVMFGMSAAELGVLPSMALANTDIALVMGDPTLTADVVSLAFTTSNALVRQSYLGLGFLGTESFEPLQFSASDVAITVSSAASPGGFQNTGRPVFGVFAEYIGVAGDQVVDAIQLLIGLNQDASIPAFVGEVVLLAQDDSPFDVVTFDESFLSEDRELTVVFLHPKLCAGVSAGITVTIDGVAYTARVAITEAMAPGNVFLVQQPANWWRPRVDPEGIVKMGPSVVFNTP